MWKLSGGLCAGIFIGFAFATASSGYTTKKLIRHEAAEQAIHQDADMAGFLSLTRQVVRLKHSVDGLSETNCNLHNLETNEPENSRVASEVHSAGQEVGWPLSRIRQSIPRSSYDQKTGRLRGD